MIFQISINTFSTNYIHQAIPISQWKIKVYLTNHISRKCIQYHVICKLYIYTVSHAVCIVVKYNSFRPWFNMKMSSYSHRKSHFEDYTSPLHFGVEDRYLRRMGDKTIPDEALPSLESFYPPWVAGIGVPQSKCCGFLVLFIDKNIF